VRIASILAIPFLPVYLADTLGYFKKEGIRVSIANMPGTSKATEALLGGSADVAGTALEHMMQLAPDGVSVKAFLNESPGVGIEEGQ
jgi:NitT/TauT family transport system substrate-binding protein